jgi:hypothetical protein
MMFSRCVRGELADTRAVSRVRAYSPATIWLRPRLEEGPNFPSPWTLGFRCDNGSMLEGRPCVICNTRRPRRYCPGVAGDICPVCCGTERENTVSCPLDCQYLREARAREKDPYVDPDQFPYKEINVDESFLRRNEPLLIFLASGLATTALETDNAIDNDIREALASLVRTYVTLQSGIVYEARPDNPIAGRIKAGLR